MYLTLKPKRVGPSTSLITSNFFRPSLSLAHLPLPTYRIVTFSTTKTPFFFLQTFTKDIRDLR